MQGKINLATPYHALMAQKVSITMSTTTTVVSLVAVQALISELKQTQAKNSAGKAEIAKIENQKNKALELFADIPEMRDHAVQLADEKIAKMKAEFGHADTSELEQNILGMVKQLPDSDLLSLITKGSRNSTGGSGTGTKRVKLVTMLDGTSQQFANKAEIVRQYIDANFDQNADGTKKSISASLFLTTKKLASAGIAKIEDVEAEPEAEADSEADSE